MQNKKETIMKYIKWIQIAYYFTQMRMARCAWEYLRGSNYSGMINKDARCLEAMNDMNSFYIKYCRAIQ